MNRPTANDGRGPWVLRRFVTIWSATLLAGLGSVSPAFAHVKWFAPYVVGAAPAPLANTLTNSWFWLGLALVLAFFLMAVLVERNKAGVMVLSGIDTVTAPLWNRADDFMRVVIGGFFVAIFAVGGVYLTPDLQTPNEWVSWLQLLIAMFIFSRRTMPFAAAGIIGLWVIALRDYELFHLLDYLALGVGVAGYLLLASFPNSKWYGRRFQILRWGVAIALMWSSLEKFAYAEWFYPLVVERPFLTLGLPRDPFIPMAGVAEFTMGFGLLWTPLIRRLSAVALIVIFTLAVYPFGRTDLVGHSLIMGTLVLIVADPVLLAPVQRTTGRALLSVPVALCAALIVIGGAYWGLHGLFYAGNNSVPVAGEHLTHLPSAEHPHDMTMPQPAD